MRFRTTLLLLAVLAALGAYLYWIELPKAEQESKKKTLAELKEDEITEVALVYPDREVLLKKSGNDWRMIKPVDALADAVAVKGVINAVAQAEISKELAEPSSDLAQYGLDKPTVTVTLRKGETALPTISIGKNTPVGSNAYVKKSDDKKVYLTSGAFRTTMDKQVKDLRDKTILSFSDADVHKIEIQGDGKDIVLSEKDNAWSIEKPTAYAADGGTVRNLLSTLRSLRAVDFPSEDATDLAAYGLDKPRLKVTLTLGNDATEKALAVGKENDQKQVYVQRGGQPAVFAVNEWVFRDLDKNVGDLRDKTVLAFDRDKVNGVQIAAKDGKVKLVRGDDKKWSVADVEGKAVESTINQYLTDLHDLKGTDVAADQPASLTEFGLDQPLVVITLFGDGQQEIGTVLLGEHKSADGKTEYTAMKAGGTTVFQVRDYTVTRLNKKADAFIEKAVTPGVAPAAPAGLPPGAAVGDEEGAGDEPMDLDAEGEE
jgi:uncharacterized protein DUF4340